MNNKPNKYITIILIAAVIYAGYTLLFSRKKKRPTAPPPVETANPAAAQGTQTQTVSESLPLPMPAADLRPKAERRTGLVWGRDPFLYPKAMGPNNKKKAVITAEEPPPLTCKVTSILVSGSQKVATIDRTPYVVAVGDRIENERVWQIMSDRVVLERNGKRHELVMENAVPDTITLKGMR